MGEPELRCRTGYLEVVNPSGLRLPALGGILGVEPGLDGVPGCRGRPGGKRIAVGYGDLQFDQIQAAGQLGDRMFHL